MRTNFPVIFVPSSSCKESCITRRHQGDLIVRTIEKERVLLTPRGFVEDMASESLRRMKEAERMVPGPERSSPHHRIGSEAFSSHRTASSTSQRWTWTLNLRFGQDLRSTPSSWPYKIRHSLWIPLPKHQMRSQIDEPTSCRIWSTSYVERSNLFSNSLFWLSLRNIKNRRIYWTHF